MKAIGFRLIGSAYKNGIRHSGATIITLDNGCEEYFSETVSLNQAVDILRARGKIDVSGFRTSLDHWVKTGQWVIQ